MTAKDKEASAAPRFIELGVVAKPHGVRGVLKVHLHNPGSDTLRGKSTLTLVHQGRRWSSGFTIVSDGFKGGLLLALDGVEHRDQAEALRGARLELDRRELAPLEPGEYLWADLEGCQVLDEQGQTLGTVHSLFEAGASDVLVVRDESSERLIPMVDQWIHEVDLAARTIHVLDADQWEAYPLK